ncbi:MAG TPA: DUF4833 domain-containing protein [Patescibacteria group bacterium]|nr:DUF4833 domain-containing protein [Patescibacteria group bacterium]
MKTLLLVAFALVTTASSAFAPAQRTVRLFHIEKNTNKNIVCYDANLNTDGTINEKNPVSAYWILHEEDGRREALSWIERKKAFGYTFEKTVNGDFILTPNADEDWKLKVSAQDGEPYAELPISGKPALVNKVVLQIEQGMILPTVKAVELFGKCPKSGTAMYEKKLID